MLLQSLYHLTGQGCFQEYYFVLRGHSYMPCIGSPDRYFLFDIISCSVAISFPLSFVAASRGRSIAKSQQVMSLGGEPGRGCSTWPRNLTRQFMSRNALVSVGARAAEQENRNGSQSRNGK